MRSGSNKNDTPQKPKEKPVTHLPLDSILTDTATKPRSKSFTHSPHNYLKESPKGTRPSPKSTLPIPINNTNGTSSNNLFKRLTRSDSVSPKHRPSLEWDREVYSIETVLSEAKEPLTHAYLNHLSSSLLKKIIIAAMEYAEKTLGEREGCFLIPVSNATDAMKDSQGKIGEPYDHHIIYIKRNYKTTYYLRDHKTTIAKGAQGELCIVYELPHSTIPSIKKEDKLHELMRMNPLVAKISSDSLGIKAQEDIQLTAGIYQYNNEYIKYIDHGVLQMDNKQYSCFITEYLYAANALKCIYVFNDQITDKDNKERIIGRRYLTPEFIFQFWIGLLEHYLEFQKKYLHGDIKPENIMLKPHGHSFRSVIIDYDDSTDSESSTRDRGTHIYIDPAKQFKRPFTKKNDLYSIGVTLYETITAHNVQRNLMLEQDKIEKRKRERQQFEKERYQHHQKELETLTQSHETDLKTRKVKMDALTQSGNEIHLQFEPIKERFDEFTFDDIHRMMPDVFDLPLLSETLLNDHHYYDWMSLSHDEFIHYLSPFLENIIDHDKKLLCENINDLIELMDFLLHSQPKLQEIGGHFLLTNPDDRPDPAVIKIFIKSLYDLSEDHKYRVENCKKFYHDYDNKFKQSVKHDPLSYVPTREKIQTYLNAIQKQNAEIAEEVSKVSVHSRM